MIAVQSSNLAAVDHDDWSDTLIIEFHNGGVYAYDNVPRSEYVGLLRASSHGGYFHAHVKNRYSCRKIAG
jgi:KTSC domain